MSNTEMLAESCGYVLNREDTGEFTISNPGYEAPDLVIEKVDGKFAAVIHVEEMRIVEMNFAEDFNQAFNRAVNSMYVFNNVLEREQNR